MDGLNRFEALVFVSLLLSGCTAPNTTSKDAETQYPSPLSGDDKPSACPAPEFMATQAVRNLNLAPEQGPSFELGSQADLIWTFPDPGTQTGRIMGVELNRGRIHPLMGSPFEGRELRVRGFRATLGSIEDGFGILWDEGSDECSRYGLGAFGLSEDETLSFANGLRNPGR